MWSVRCDHVHLFTLPQEPRDVAGESRTRRMRTVCLATFAHDMMRTWLCVCIKYPVSVNYSAIRHASHINLPTKTLYLPVFDKV